MLLKNKQQNKKSEIKLTNKGTINLSLKKVGNDICKFCKENRMI